MTRPTVFRTVSTANASGIPASNTGDAHIRDLNGFVILSAVVAFSMGAGIGSGLGYRMGSSQIAVYTNDAYPQRESEYEAQTIDQSVALAAQRQDDQMQNSVKILQQQLEEVEQRLAALEIERNHLEPGTAVPDTVDSPRIASFSSDQLRQRLQSAGFSEGEYQVISTTRDQLRLKRLQLRDKAIREGWFRTDAWTRQLRELNPDAELRKTLGDQRFDDYLIASGRNNRVKIDELMTGSAASMAGLMVGDLIHRYADLRVFSSGELRRLTTGGQIGENTALTILREGELIDLTVPRGPLGVVISGVTHAGVDQN